MKSENKLFTPEVKRTFALLKKHLYSFCIYPQFFVCAVFFNLAVFVHFIISGQIFIYSAGSLQLSSFFSVFPYLMIITVPVLCTVLSGNCDFSLPFSTLKIILSRILSLEIVFSVMLLPCLIFVLSLNFLGFVDFGQVFTGFLVILFYSLASFSFAVFVFESVPNAAFLICTISLSFITFIHNLLLYVQLPQYISRLIRFFSFTWHFFSAQKGIFDSRDALFFLIFSILFAGFTCFFIERKKGLKSLKKIFMSFLLFIAVFYVDSIRFYKRIDFTENHRFSASEYTKKLLINLDEPVRINYYQSKEVKELYPQISGIEDYLNEYSGFSKKIVFEVKDASKPENISILNQLGISGQQFNVVKNNQKQMQQVYSAITIEYLGASRFIPFVLSDETLEYDLAVNIEKLVSGKDFKVYVLCGNGMNFSEDYSYVKPWLSSQGFEVLELSPDFFESNNDSFLDRNIPLIVFGCSKLNEFQCAGIENFVLSGGKMFAAVSPFSTDVKGTWKIELPAEKSFFKMLSGFGFEFSSQLITDSDCAEITMYSENNSVRKIKYPFWIHLNEGRGITLFWASPLNLYNQAIKPVLKTNPSAAALDMNVSSESLFETNPFSFADTFEINCEKHSFITGAFLEGNAHGFFTGKESDNACVYVLAEENFVNSLLLGYSGGENGDYRNFYFLSDVILNLCGKKDLAELLNKGYTDYSLSKIRQKKLLNIQKIFIFVYLIFVPLLIVLVKIIFTLWRFKTVRRKL